MGFMADQKARNEAAKAYKAEHGVSPATAQYREQMTEIRAEYDEKKAGAKVIKTARQDADDTAHRLKRERKEARKAAR